MRDIFERDQERGLKIFPGMDAMNLGSLDVAARASMVNRTHRIVRERAKQMSSRRRHFRSLVAPLAVSAAMLVILVTAVWTLLDEYEASPTGFVDSSNQYMVLLLWFLPLSVALLGMVWFTRIRGRRSGSELIR